MKCLVVLSCLTLAFLTPGCVIAPVPLVETIGEYRWSGPDENGKEIRIEAKIQTWYLPIVASPEGPAKHRADSSSFTYFVFNGTDSSFSYDRGEDVPWEKGQPLPWLDLKANGSYDWFRILRIEGTAYWVAFRIVDFKAGSQRTREDKPDWEKFEIAVFDLHGLKDKRTITILPLPHHIENAKGYLDYWGYDSTKQTIEYNLLDGKRRCYHLLEAREESLSPKVDQTSSPTSPIGG